MKIAIVRRNGLGDLLTAMPLVLLCKERFAGCHITLFVDHRNAPLLPYLEGVDETVIIAPSKNKYLSLLKTVWACKHRSFDLVVSARPKPMQWVNLFLRCLKTARRRAVVDSTWHSRWINEPQLYEPDICRHQMVRSLRLLDPLLEEVPSHLLPVIRAKPSRQFDQPALLVSVSNYRIGSQLDSDKIVSHLNRALEKHDFQVIINCIPKDLARARLISAGLQMKHEVIATPSFDEFMSLLASAHGCWTGDGGVMHLAAALGKPQLILFGKTELEQWAPLSNKAICLWHT